MIEEIRIENFALLSDIHLKFYEGLNIIMGETGSGKSSLIDAISILFGDRASRDKIRMDADHSYISMALNISDPAVHEYLKSLNICLEDEPLIISRTIRRGANTISKINNRTVTAQNLRDLSKYIIDIYGQFENILILSKTEQLKFLDRLGDLGYKNLLSDYRSAYADYIEAQKALDEFEQSPEELNRNIEFYKYQYKDIKDSGILELDEENVMSSLEKIENSKGIQSDIAKSLDLLDGEAGAITILGRIIQRISNIEKYSNEYSEIKDRLQSILIESEDIKLDLQSYSYDLDYNEEEYYQLDRQRSLIFEMKQKYGESIEEIEEFYIELEQNLEQLQNYSDKIESLNTDLDKKYKKSYSIAKRISEKRKVLAKELELKIKSELVGLEMEDSNFEIKFSDTDLSTLGLDEIDFMVSFNKDQKLMKFSEVASGGEISRFMLGIKSIEADIDKTPILIFDEIDTGISGNAGNVVGDKLKELSKSHLLICVSHLPQIIAKADNQYLVYKTLTDDKVSSNIKKLNYEQRVVELAKTIQGDSYNEHTLSTAKNMIDGNKGDNNVQV